MILAKRRKARNGAHEQEFQEFKHHARKPAQQERARPHTGERHGYTRGTERFVYRAPYRAIYCAPYGGGYCASFPQLD
jgi:hypothetical protein